MDDRDVWRDAMQRALEAETHEERRALVAWAAEWRAGIRGAAIAGAEAAKAADNLPLAKLARLYDLAVARPHGFVRSGDSEARGPATGRDFYGWINEDGTLSVIAPVAERWLRELGDPQPRATFDAWAAAGWIEPKRGKRPDWPQQTAPQGGRPRLIRVLAAGLDAIGAAP